MNYNRIVAAAGLAAMAAGAVFASPAQASDSRSYVVELVYATPPIPARRRLSGRPKPRHAAIQYMKDLADFWATTPQQIEAMATKAQLEGGDEIADA
jgi:hypothetical protein